MIVSSAARVLLIGCDVALYKSSFIIIIIIIIIIIYMCWCAKSATDYDTPPKKKSQNRPPPQKVCWKKCVEAEGVLDSSSSTIEV